MLIKSFYGESMHQALQAATRQLGEDALIWNSRETPVELRSHGRFEVVATVEGPAPLQPGNDVAGIRLAEPPEVHVLAGLNGAGKTTCALKMGIKYGVWQGRKTAIVHFDTNRIARQESLAWYCQAAGIACVDGTKFDPDHDYQLLLVDTSNAPVKLPGWLESAKQSPQYAAHLVAPAWAGENYFIASQPLAAAYQAKFLLPTFLDNSHLGEEASSAAAKLNLGIRFISKGAKVPIGLEETASSPTSAVAVNPSPKAPSGEQIAHILRRNPVSVSDRKWARGTAASMVA